MSRLTLIRNLYSTFRSESRLVATMPASTISSPTCLRSPPVIPHKLLMGPGPSNVPQRVREAMGWDMLGHLHPEFIQIMDDVKEGLKFLFQTNSRYILAVSGTGHAALEASMVNVIERDTVVLVAVHGEWGIRASDIAERLGACVKKIVTNPGSVFTLEAIEQALKTHKPSVFFLCHGESSTGALHPLQGVGDMCHRYNCLFIVDTVASAGGVPLYVDDLGIDIVYSGSQKCLSAPVAPSPIAFSTRAVDYIKSRQTKPCSFSLDMNHLFNYWGCEGEARRYHHTNVISNVYGLRESLAILAEKGLEASWRQHEACAQKLWKGLEDMGLEMFVSDKMLRLPTVTTVKIPPGVNGKEVIDAMMKKHQIEISGGLGPTLGLVWRIGVMGHNATDENIEKVLSCLRAEIRVESPL